MIFEHANPDSAVLRARMDGSETSTLEVSAHCERGALRKIESDDGEGKRDVLVCVFLVLFPRKRNVMFPLRRNVICHEFLARLVSHRRWPRKRPRQRFEVIVVPIIELSRVLLSALLPLYYFGRSVIGHVVTIATIPHSVPPCGCAAAVTTAKRPLPSVRTPCLAGRLGIARY